jgi:hypothetical protein
MYVQLLFGMFFKVLSSKGGPYSCTDLARFSRQQICGIVCVCKLFSWLLNVILMLIYFPEANKISLSLGFPTMGFSLAGCLNF